MRKNVVICCDGTGNEFGDDNSNVAKLCQALIEDTSQVVYYHPGVGTMGAPAARNRLEEYLSQAGGLLFGNGLLSNIEDAYRFLMDLYEDGDHIYLFGFSRGAYTVRGLAGVLHMFGLLRLGNEGLIRYVIRMFAKKSRKEGGFKRTLDVSHNFKYTFSRDYPIHFVGVWDTVSSIGWVYSPIVLPFAGCNPSIKIGRHAVSLDERRCFFDVTLWDKPDPHQDIKQVWFTGVHSDVISDQKIGSWLLPIRPAL